MVLLPPFLKQLRTIFQNSTLITQLLEEEISKTGFWMLLEHHKIRPHMVALVGIIISRWLWPKEEATHQTWYTTWTLDRALRLNEDPPAAKVLDHKPSQVCNSTKQWPTPITLGQRKQKPPASKETTSKVAHKDELMWATRNWNKTLQSQDQSEERYFYIISS